MKRVKKNENCKEVPEGWDLHLRLIHFGRHGWRRRYTTITAQQFRDEANLICRTKKGGSKAP